MRRRWLVIPLAIAAIAAIWIAGGGKVDTVAFNRFFGDASAPPTARTKPICSQVIVPAGDCIPQHLANLPPDPGPAGKKTIEGIDSDKDGVRDDVQRYIAEKWGHSERAVKALTLIALNAQTQVTIGDSVSRDEAYEIAKKMGRSVDCYARTIPPKIQQERALDFVETQVTNTPERFDRWTKFEKLTANRVYLLSELDEPLADLCGYDPAKLPN